MGPKFLKLAQLNGTPFEKGIISNGWWDRLFERHPKLRSRIGSKIDRLHASGANRDVISSYFKQVGALIEAGFLAFHLGPSFLFSLLHFSSFSLFPLLNSPQAHPELAENPNLIWNFDESATKQTAALQEQLTTEQITPKVLQAIKSKNLTGVFFVSAGGLCSLFLYFLSFTFAGVSISPPPLSGLFMAPTFILPDTKMRGMPEWADQASVDSDPFKNEARFAVAPKGWTDTDITFEVINNFIEQVCCSFSLQFLPHSIFR